MRLKINEHQIQNQIISAGWLKGWFVMRLNSGQIRTDKGHVIKLSEPGTPDLMLFKQGVSGLEIMFFEVKTPKGVVTTLQAQKMKDLMRYGASCYVVRSLDEAMQYL